MIDQPKETLNELLNFKKSLLEVSYSSNTFIKFNILMRPLLEWIELTRALVKSYFKSIDNPP